MKCSITRRHLLKASVAAGIGVAALSRHSVGAWAAPIGANGDIRLAVVGLNGHGTGAHLNAYVKMKGVRIVALCDPDRAVLANRAARFAGGPKVETYTDIRKLLERKDVDAISGATPNHWHALSTVWACQAGKHVCVEKPVSHSIWEGRRMVEAAEKYGRLVQADLDLRSNGGMQEAIDYIHRKELGRVLMVHSWVYKRRASMGQVDGAGKVPESVDYNLWCGPAPKVPLPRKRLHYDWHWQWDYGCGEIGNNGPHHLDVCRWALGEPGLPRRVITVGGRFGYKDDGQTPNTSVTLFDYPSAPILFEVRGLPRKTGDNRMDAYSATSVGGVKLSSAHDSSSPNNGTIVVCEEGIVNLDARTAHDKTGRQIQKFGGGGVSSADNFIKALRSGKTDDLHTTILNGHLSTSLCHMGNISYRVGAAATRDEIHDQIKRSDEAMDAVERMAGHLSANGVNLSESAAVLGPVLRMDSEREQFVGPFAEQANRLVKRYYREPFAIRETV